MCQAGKAGTDQTYETVQLDLNPIFHSLSVTLFL